MRVCWRLAMLTAIGSAHLTAQRLQSISIPTRPSASEICSGNNQCSNQSAVHQRKKLHNDEKTCAQALRDLESEKQLSATVKLASCYRH